MSSGWWSLPASIVVWASGLFALHAAALAAFLAPLGPSAHKAAVAAAGIFLMTLLGLIALFNHAARLMARQLRASIEHKSPVAPAIFFREGGSTWKEVADLCNTLLAESTNNRTARAPGQIYESYFLKQSDPAFICDFESGQMLDCNQSFADFLENSREDILSRRLGNTILMSSDKEADAKPDEIQRTCRFEYRSGLPKQTRSALTFLHTAQLGQGRGRKYTIAFVIPDNNPALQELHP